MDLTEVELVDQYDSVPRGNETQLLAVSIILAETKILYDHDDVFSRCTVYLYTQRVLKMHILRITNTLQLP